MAEKNRAENCDLARLAGTCRPLQCASDAALYDNVQTDTGGMRIFEPWHLLSTGQLSISPVCGGHAVAELPAIRHWFDQDINL